MASPAPKTAGDLTGAEYNPRHFTPDELEALGKSMEEHGDLSGIVFNRRSGKLIGAHQRRTHIPDAAKIELIGPRARKPNKQGTIANGWITLGEERWAYREVDVDEDREKVMNVAANRFGEGNWDYSMLPDVLRPLADLPDIDMSMTGFSVAELKLLTGMGLDSSEAPGEFPELDPTIANDVKTATCPQCGHEFPHE